MEERDVLFELATRVDNRTLGLLNLTPSWNVIATFADTSYFWYIRTQNLLGVELTPRPTGDWKSVYYELQYQMIENDNNRTFNVFTDSLLSSPTAVSVAIELGYRPSSTSLVIACQSGYTQTVSILLQQPGIDPTTSYSRCLLSQYADIVKLLLEDGRADPRDNEGWALLNAVNNNNVEVVRLLLEDGRVDPAADNNNALNTAIDNGQDEIANLLLLDERVSSTMP